MIPLLGTLTLPALSVIAGIVILFLLVTVPDWYNRHTKAKQNVDLKKESSNGIDSVQSLDKKVKKPRSKPSIELSKISKEENSRVLKDSCACEDADGKKDTENGCCKGGSGDVDMCCSSKPQTLNQLITDESIKKVVIVYGTTTGNSKQFAKMLSDGLESKAINGITTEIFDMSDIEAEDRLPVWAKEVNTAFVVITSTYEGGSPPNNAGWFFKWLDESSKDFRVQHSMLKGLKYAVF